MNLSPGAIHRKLQACFTSESHPESPYPNGLLDSNPQPAAVLIPFIWDADEWHLLFIRRTTNVYDRHAGQVAFPGGRSNPEETTAESTALRETWEEVGVAPEDVKILGKMRDMLTITNYRVTPVVGMIPWPYSLIPQPEEVARIFRIPLGWIADPKNRYVRQRTWPAINGSIPVIYFKPYDGETLWGASARITMLLLEALGLSEPEYRYN